jgi:hypothetical protein
VGEPFEGYEIQILDDAPEAVRRTGAIYTFAGPDGVLSLARASGTGSR